MAAGNVADNNQEPTDLASVLEAMREHVAASTRSFPGEGLRERKKRLTRQQISDAATIMFLERGFDEVRVADVADACGVSEKTVYNYFPTKESLLLDREPEMADAVRRALGPEAPNGSPVYAFVDELLVVATRMTDGWSRLPPGVDWPGFMRRFRAMVATTPSLRAAQRDMMDRISTLAAEELAKRARVDPASPEPQIAAVSICGLWGVFYASLERHASTHADPHAVLDGVSADLYRAARLIDTGLWSFGLAVEGKTGPKQIKQAAEAANEARKQVIIAVRAAKAAWAQIAQEAGHAQGRGGGPPRGAPSRGGAARRGGPASSRRGGPRGQQPPHRRG